MRGLLLKLLTTDFLHTNIPSCMIITTMHKLHILFFVNYCNGE